MPRISVVAQVCIQRHAQSWLGPPFGILIIVRAVEMGRTGVAIYFDAAHVEGDVDASRILKESLPDRLLRRAEPSVDIANASYVA